MAEQSFQNHTHRPTHTAIAGLFALVALILMVQHDVLRLRARATGRSSAPSWRCSVLAAISRVYTVRLQDRIIMLEEKVRAAELLPAGQDAQLAKLSSKQIAALRFASDEEFGALLERAARENLAPKDIKAAVKTWRPDLLSHLTKARAGDPGRTTGSPAPDRRARTHAAGVPRLRRDDARPGVGSEARQHPVRRTHWPRRSPKSSACSATSARSRSRSPR